MKKVFRLKKIYCLLICFYSLNSAAQSAYNQWASVQEDEVHLMGNYKAKTIYESATGSLENLKLSQQQVFDKNRMIRDVMYLNYPSQKMYDIVINYAADGTASGVNLLDSSLVTYSFTEDNKILYYVVEQQSDLHIIYTYDEDGLLIRCKDCLFPFEDHQWCAYYNYYYNEDKTLQKAESYSLEKGKAIESKTLFAYDSLIYENGQLLTRQTISPFGVVTNEVVYTYNKHQLLEKEVSKQSTSQFLEAKSYSKNYTYYCNKKLKFQVESYFSNEALLGKQLVYYDKKGRKIKQESFKADGVKSKLYLIKYK